MGKRHFSKEAYRWLINTWKDAQHHSLLKKCKSKLLWDITSHQWEWPSSKSLQTINAGEGVEKREPSFTAGRKGKLIQPLWKMVWKFPKKKTGIKPPYDPAIPLLGIYPEEPKLKKIHVSHCSLKHYLQQLEHGSNLDVHHQING